MKRIKLLSDMTPEGGSPVLAAPTPPHSTATNEVAPSAALAQPTTSTALASPATQKTRAQIHQEKRESARAAKEHQKHFSQILRAAEIAIPILEKMERLRAAVPDLDPIKQQQEVKARSFSSG